MKRILYFTCLALLPFVSHAAKFDILLMGGPALSNLSNDSHVNINQYMVNAYHTQSREQVQPVIGIGVGHTFTTANKPLNVSLGLSSYYINYDKISGTEYPFINDGIYDSLNYQFKVKSFDVMLESRFIYTQFKWQPFALVGVGAAWNRLYNYNETPTISSNSAAASPYPFSNNTMTSFAYEAGIGVQRQLFINSSYALQYFLALEYRYINNGKGKLGASAAQTTSDRLQISNLEMQTITATLKVTV